MNSKIACDLPQVTYLAEETVVTQGDVVRELLILESGSLQERTQDEESSDEDEDEDLDRTQPWEVNVDDIVDDMDVSDDGTDGGKSDDQVRGSLDQGPGGPMPSPKRTKTPLAPLHRLHVPRCHSSHST